MTILHVGPPVSNAHAWRRIAGATVLWTALYAGDEPVLRWWWLDVVRLDPTARFTGALLFLCADLVKILLLIVGITTVVTTLRSYLTIERTRALLSGRREGLGNLLAAALGIGTPFCSCSAVPAFIGFVGAGIPIGVTMTFLIASPLINEIAVGMLWSMFGWRIAIAYVSAGFVIAVVAGAVIGRIGAERWVERFVLETRVNARMAALGTHMRLNDRLDLGVDEARAIVRRIWPYLLVGIGLGAAIHGWAPTAWFAQHAGADNPFAVLVAVAVGVPLYSNAAGAMPIVQALHQVGVPMGTLLAFMMSVVGLSFPELVLLKRVLRPQLLAVFVGVVATGIIIIGYCFNIILT